MSRILSIKLSRAEASQLLSYTVQREIGSDAGWYYGSKASFDARHASIKQKLEEALDATALERPADTTDASRDG
jgi:hypothetical protein